ncbi:MAG: hypothetical protein IJF59_04825 [Clostridia bacterium]|nr:hypothetical protein [Clostridia bacterium]
MTDQYSQHSQHSPSSQPIRDSRNSQPSQSSQPGPANSNCPPDRPQTGAAPRCTGLLCGAVTAALQFWFIPNFLARGVPDAVWMALMVILPAAAAVALFQAAGAVRPCALLWALLTEVAAALLFHRPLGGLLGYRLESFQWDLFDFVAYGFFTLGWAVAATVAQLVTLTGIRRFRERSPR